MLFHSDAGLGEIKVQNRTLFRVLETASNLQELFRRLGSMSDMQLFLVGVLSIENEFMQPLENYKTSHV